LTQKSALDSGTGWPHNPTVNSDEKQFVLSRRAVKGNFLSGKALIRQRADFQLCQS
jgi:hypothetical protein